MIKINKIKTLLWNLKIKDKIIKIIDKINIITTTWITTDRKEIHLYIKIFDNLV
jgi:hypothetical protein